MTQSFRAVLVGMALAVASLVAAPVSAQTFTLPELGFQSSGTCRQLAVRDRDSKAMVPLGCMTSGKWQLTPDSLQITGTGSTGDTSGMSARVPNGAARTLAERAFDRISILDYGGRGNFDGSAGTDNLAAWNAAAATGKCVYFPPGAYYFSAATPQVTNKTLCIKGDSVEASQIVFASAASGGFSANQSDFRYQVHVSDISIKTLGNENGTALSAIWSDADATFNVNQRRMTISNVLLAGNSNQGQGWRRGIYAKNAQASSIQDFTFVGRTTATGPGGSQVEADLTHADEGVFLDNGAFGTLGGYMTRVRITSAKSCVTIYSAQKSIEGVNFSQFDCGGAAKGINFDTFLDSPGLVVANGHISAFRCGICGKNFTQAQISSLLIYKIPNGPGADFYGIDSTSSDNINFSNSTLINQNPNLANGNFYGIRLTDSNYAQLTNNAYFIPTCGVVISGASSENFGTNQITSGQIGGGSTGAVCDTSGGNNNIGTGSFLSKQSSSGAPLISTAGIGLVSTAERAVYTGQKYRVSGSLKMASGGSATEAALSISKAGDSTALCDFGLLPNELTDRRPMPATSSVSMSTAGICTVTQSGTLRFMLYGTSVGGNSQGFDKGAQITMEQL
ncbi:hypothetical protein GU700_22665 [Methylobacterium sp. NI91]|nr:MULTISPECIES: glycosyl hydrolase family 28-related protein [unclassified Methylobacterium]QIJ77125.1 hypothetical protein CLZ_22670 [Methylobacterium sp. CLZ]QIJ82029.1 hypothetical protein GU700_22665 [Methylobacterium sp. NI91]